MPYSGGGPAVALPGGLSVSGDFGGGLELSSNGTYTDMATAQANGFVIPNSSYSGGTGFGSALGYAGAGSALLGGIVGAIGANNAAQGQSDAYLGQARGFNQNAEAVGDTAGNIWSAWGRQNSLATYNANQLVGKQRAGYAAGNVGPSGSPLDVLADTENQVRTEAMNRFYTSTERGHAAGMQYGLDQENAQAATDAASRARSSADTGIFSSILQGIGSGGTILAKFLGGGV